ncbi:protein RER1-like [Lucilia cuprina]|uniref:protein RER1-like n=1 Tax=Lucilia cuprina TaxID=7375 RepID=UPI001F05599F|nr:protein RER1-like [Lucilia cuprina]
MMNEDTTASTSSSGGVKKFFLRISQIYQSALDRSTPHTKARWIGAAVLVLIFLLRIFLNQGWYIVCYALGIYHLNLFIAFLTPKIDPEFDPYANEGEFFFKLLSMLHSLVFLLLLISFLLIFLFCCDLNMHKKAPLIMDTI